MSHKIPVGKHHFALVDKADLELVSKHKWYLVGRYAVSLKYIRGSGRANQKQERIFMHRLILNTPENLFTDHINGNTLDNRRGNLRIVTRQQNMWNSRAKGGSSVYKGIFWSKIHNKWRTRVKKNRKIYEIGLFEKERHAAMAHDIWAKELHGEYAFLNFN